MDFERRVAGRFVKKVFADADGAVVRTLARAGLEVQPPEEAAVPVEQFNAALRLYAQARYPHLPLGEAVRRVGFDVVQRHRTVDDVADVRGVLQRFSGKLQSVGPFFELTLREKSASHTVVHFDDVASVPTFFQGMFEAATSSTREQVEVRWVPEGLSGARYEVRVTPAYDAATAPSPG